MQCSKCGLEPELEYIKEVDGDLTKEYYKSHSVVCKNEDDEVLHTLCADCWTKLTALIA